MTKKTITITIDYPNLPIVEGDHFDTPEEAHDATAAVDAWWINPGNERTLETRVQWWRDLLAYAKADRAEKQRRNAFRCDECPKGFATARGLTQHKSYGHD